MRVNENRISHISKSIVFLAALAAVVLLSVGTPSCAEFEANLLSNGDLSSGDGHAATGWHARSLAFDKTLASFGWDRLPDGGGEIFITNTSPLVSYWQRGLALSPGWYRLSAEVKVSGGWIGGGGALLGIQTFDGLRMLTSSVSDAPNWKQVEFYLLEDQWGDTNALFCQLGRDERPTSGWAAFRNILVVRVASPPLGTETNQFDLAAIRRSRGSPIDYPDSSVRAVGKLCAFVLLGLMVWAVAVVWRPGMETAGRWTQFAVTAMVAITVVKIASLFYFTGYYWDVYSKTKRALVMAAVGPGRIYAPGTGVDGYPPASVYLLWLSGWMGRLLRPGGEVLRVLVETPPLIADLLIGLTIFFAVTRTRGARLGILAMILFALNPALIFDTVVWGQSDSVVALAMLLGALLVLMKRTRLGWSVAAIAVLAKPQALSMLPPLALWTLIDAGIAESAICAMIFAATAALGVLPYQIGHPLNWTLQIYQDLANRYPGASLGAFNFVGLIGGINQLETDTLAGISFFAIGIVLASAAYTVSALMVLRARTEAAVMTAIFVALFGFFMFLPRMHQRYLYYSLVFLALLAVNSRKMTWIFGVLTTTFLANLLYSKYLIDISGHDDGYPELIIVPVGLLNVAAFIAVVYWGLFVESGESPASHPRWIPWAHSAVQAKESAAVEAPD